jgi:hypothetical protein
MVTAVIELYPLTGAKISATVETQEKKALLMDVFKILEDGIFYNRGGNLGKGIMRTTSANGANVIFNSLAAKDLGFT